LENFKILGFNNEELKVKDQIDITKEFVFNAMNYGFLSTLLETNEIKIEYHFSAAEETIVKWLYLTTLFNVEKKIVCPEVIALRHPILRNKLLPKQALNHINFLKKFHLMEEK
jgi:hypothetical protein